MEATQSKAVERYLLGEMSVPDRDRFEEHFFTCTDCAEEVRVAAIFADNARAVLSGQASASLASSYTGTEAGAGWFSWLWRPAIAVPLAAGLLLIISIASYQNLVVIPQLRREVAQAAAPQYLPSFALKSVSRGNDQVITVPKGSRYFHLLLDKTWERSAAFYRCQLHDASGKVQITVDLPASDPVNLLLPAARLTAGPYTLVVQAPEGPELARHPFDLQFQ